MNYLVEIFEDRECVDSAIFSDVELAKRFTKALRSFDICCKRTTVEDHVFPADTLVTSDNFVHMVEIYITAWSCR